MKLTNKVERYSYINSYVASFWIFIVAQIFNINGLSTPSTTMKPVSTNNFLGFDLGTSGARISIIKENSLSPESTTQQYEEVYTDSITWTSSHPYDDPKAWIFAMDTLLQNASEQRPDLLKYVNSICASGTSASCLLINSQQNGEVTRKPRMYNYDIMSEGKASAIKVNEYLDKHAPPRHTARANTGSLAKLLLWQEQKQLQPGEEILAHQSDYCAMHLLYDNNKKECGSGLQERKRIITSDWHNCLKLGYDVKNLQWPSWLVSCLQDSGIKNPYDVLPSEVISPGKRIGTIAPSIQEKYGLPSNCVVVGGTTDSNAAFFAAIGGTRADYGTAVTSLGSTLAMKLLSQQFCEDADRGVYSHRFPLFDDDGVGNNDKTKEAWLVGGASNVGCLVLRQQDFSNEELVELSKEIDPAKESPLKYYPLTKAGERFPIADSEREPLLTPRPESRKEFLHGILQSISDVEKEGFEVLGDLGASPSRPTMVWSCGGGAKNDMWLKMREIRLSTICKDGIKVDRAENTEASYGAAILAAGTF